MPLRIRLPSLERELDIRLMELDERVIHRLVTDGVAESQQLDFKTTWDQSAEVAKDVCAFANARGGLLVYGVRDEDGVAVEATPFQPLGGELRARVAQLLRDHCRPVPAFDVAEIPTADGMNRFIVIGVPPSADAPHAQRLITKDDVWYRFPVRYETTTSFLVESELASRYETRLRSGEFRLARTRELADTHHASLPNSGRPLARLTLVTTPVNPGSATINDDLVRKWGRQGMRFHDGTWSFGVSPGLHSTGAERVVYRGVRFACVDGSVQLQSDGTAIFAFTLESATAAVGLDRIGNPEPLDSDFLFARFAGMNAFGALWASDGCGSAGDMFVNIRLDVLTPHGTHRKMVLAGPSGNDDLIVPLAGSDGATETIRCELTTSIEVHLDKPTTVWVAEMHRLLSDITQALGLAGPHTSTNQGAVRLSAWSPIRREQVANWARTHDIEAL